MRRKQRPTPEQHRAFGKSLRDVVRHVAGVHFTLLGRVTLDLLQYAGLAKERLAQLCGALVLDWPAGSGPSPYDLTNVGLAIAAPLAPDASPAGEAGPSRCRLNLGQYHALGRALLGIRDELMTLLGRLLDAYPRTSVPVRKLRRAIEEVDILRCLLDSRFATDFPDEFDTHVFYPGTAGFPPTPGANAQELP